MPKQKTQSQVIEEFLRVHGQKYDYSKVEYENTNKKVVVVCPIHGDFEVTPQHHKSGVGCKKCHFDSQKITKEKFVQKSQDFFGNRYDYSLFETMPSGKEKVQIKCNEHNEIFLQEPRNHMRGHTGCPKCLSNILSGSGEQVGKFTTQKELNDTFIKKAKQIHGYKYDYSEFIYINSDTTGKIICKLHGEFHQTPSNHLKGTKCPQCAIEDLKENTFKNECKKRGVDYYRALKRRQSGQSEEQIFKKDYIRNERAINEIKIFDKIYPNLKEAIRELKTPANRKTIARWIKDGMSPEEAFDRVPNPGYEDGTIYLITNTLTNKQYVGLTIQSIERRWQYHLEQANASKIKNENSLHASIRKYGADKFTITQIDSGVANRDLEAKEIEWIKKLNTLIPNGYNISTGGTSGGSNKKPTTVDGITFVGNKEAVEHVAKTRGISIVAAKKRLEKGKIDVKSPAKAGQSLVKTKTYKVWSRIKNGVLNPNSKDYIEGISLYEEWMEFEKFYKDVGEPIEPKIVFARIDKTKGFYPDNCRWMTKSEASKINAQYMKNTNKFKENFKKII